MCNRNRVSWHIFFTCVCYANDKKFVIHMQSSSYFFNGLINAFKTFSTYWNFYFKHFLSVVQFLLSAIVYEEKVIFTCRVENFLINCFFNIKQWYTVTFPKTFCFYLSLDWVQKNYSLQDNQKLTFSIGILVKIVIYSKYPTNHKRVSYSSFSLYSTACVENAWQMGNLVNITFMTKCQSFKKAST